MLTSLLNGPPCLYISVLLCLNNKQRLHFHIRDITSVTGIDCWRTFRVPVHMSDVTWASFTDSNSLTTQHIINIHKVVMWRYSQIFTLTCDKRNNMSFRCPCQITELYAWKVDKLTRWEFDVWDFFFPVMKSNDVIQSAGVDDLKAT